jgi:hypothetical protein
VVRFKLLCPERDPIVRLRVNAGSSRMFDGSMNR